MLRSIIILTTGGVPKYSKAFKQEDTQNHQLLGSLITAMLRFCELKTGFPVSFVRFQEMVIAVSTSLKHNIRCIVFADVEDDNSNFTKIICHQLLEGFCYLTKTKGLASTDFDSYIGSMIRSATRPILYRLRTIRPITHFALVEGNNLICSTLDVDRVGLIATLVALIDRSTETMGAMGSSATSYCFSGNKQGIQVFILGQRPCSGLILLTQRNSDSSTLSQLSYNFNHHQGDLSNSYSNHPHKLNNNLNQNSSNYSNIQQTTFQNQINKALMVLQSVQA